MVKSSGHVVWKFRKNNAYLILLLLYWLKIYGVVRGALCK